MAEIRKRIVFHGRVQGVGFRYTAKYLAQSLELTGWVRNDWDQTVTMEVQGREALINNLLVGLNKGELDYEIRIYRNRKYGGRDHGRHYQK